MKKIFIVIMSVVSFFSCTNEEMEGEESFAHIIYYGYTPKGVPKEIVLSTGEKIYMDIDSTFYSGDMIFSKEQVEAMTRTATRSAAIKARVHYWPNKSIPYKINSGFSSTDISYINQALQAISNETNIQFVETNNPPAQHIEFMPTPNSNHSPVGMQSNGNYIYLGTTYLSLGIALHEIMHTLGFFHEHQRSDRDSYVNIYWGNIASGSEENFYKYTDWGYEGYDIGSFDFNSVMMYSSWDCSYNNSSLTIVKKEDNSFILAETNLSLGDKKGLRFLYGPETIHLNTEIVYENYYDDNEYIEYENYVDFRDSIGNPTTLNHPRLIVVNFYEYRYDRSSGHYTNYSHDEYYVVPSESSTYCLNGTEYTHEEEGYGIVRTHYESSYSVYNY